MTQSMNLALGANFNLLKTNLAAMFEKDETGNKILLVPTKINSPTPVTLKRWLMTSRAHLDERRRLQENWKHLGCGRHPKRRKKI
mgnify:CR=1 FL=1